MLSNEQSVIHPETYKLKLGASPHIAARQENIRITLQSFELPQTKNGLVIEGAGGLMVPINEYEFVADLIKLFDTPVILVSRNMLGSINHSILTAMACRQLGLKVIGWIFNDDYMEYEKEIEEWTGYPALASIPYNENADKQFIGEQAELIRSKLDRWPW
jgi:dethiobiotin synthetase